NRDEYYYTTQTIKQMLYTCTGLILHTFDLWTSCAHNSYLDITYHWISNEFHINDLILGVIELGAYKTANDIVKFFEPMLEEFGTEKNKTLSITTDNGTNFKAAITKLSTSLLVSKLIANIFCAAYTLQLSINTDLEIASIGEKKKKAIKRSSIKLSILEVNVVNVIKDIDTRWNSMYMALERLAKLEQPI
ncbi:22306_t:CDS:2, partial [Gigaspora margarita]